MLHCFTALHLLTFLKLGVCTLYLQHVASLAASDGLLGGMCGGPQVLAAR